MLSLMPVFVKVHKGKSQGDLVVASTGVTV